MTNEIAINGYSLDFYKTFDHNNLEEMRLEANDGYADFLFRRDASILTISGSYSYAMFGWFSNCNTLKDIAKYAQSLQYFASKCIAHSTDNKPLIYDANKVRKDVVHYLDEHDYTEDGFKKKKQEDNPTEFTPFDKRDDLIEAIAECFDYNYGFDLNGANDIFSPYTPNDVADALNYIDPNAQFDFGSFTSVAPIVKTYSNMLNTGVKLIEKNGLVIPPVRKDQNDQKISLYLRISK